MNKTHLLTIASVAGVDRITKYLITQHIPLDDDVEVIPGFFRLTHLRNPGSAFSLFAESASRWRTPALVAFSIAALVTISVLLWKNRETNLHTIALSLVFGGTLGNLWDRLASGAVTDFLDFYLGSHHWYPFNIADSAIVVGALLLLSEVFFAQLKEA
ncbi:MAG TPA: signal peptidase II [Candidatus Angelobacter sp.]|jgi:signal peptidase II|nr:signal peptidase II [Candidatus Angelobacter sp.]